MNIADSTKHQIIITRNQIKIQKGHLNHSQQYVRSTKHKLRPSEVCNVTQIKGKQEQAVYTPVYDAWETIYSDQIGNFPKEGTAR